MIVVKEGSGMRPYSIHEFDDYVNEGIAGGAE